MFPRLFWYFVRMQRIMWFVMMRLGALTSVTSINVLADILSYAWPPETPCDEFLCLKSSWVSCGLWVMMFPNDVDTYGIRRNVDAFLICYYSVSVVIPILAMCSKCFNHLSIVVFSSDV